jgi:GAF domain-containing protein
MSESLIYKKGAGKYSIYEDLLPQIKGLLDSETNAIANMANMAAVLKEAFGFLWVGFYLVRNNQLVLGPFQGSVACSRIEKGKGVCGSSWEQAQTIIVPDVNKFDGHIACSSLSRSEIVVPAFHQGKVVGVLDIDSDILNAFDDIDAKYLEIIVGLLHL